MLLFCVLQLLLLYRVHVLDSFAVFGSAGSITVPAEYLRQTAHKHLTRAGAIRCANDALLFHFFDQAGRTAIDWGVYGVPETFVIGKDGKIAYKHVGPLTAESVKTLLLPQIEKALAAPG